MNAHEIDTVVRESGLSLEYGVVPERLSAEFARSFVPSAADSALAEFVLDARVGRAGVLKTLAFRALCSVLSDYEAYGLLGMYRMHLLSTEQWGMLLARDPATARGTLLDIGAGDGGVTQHALPMFERACATEHAKALSRVLARRGVEVFEHDFGSAPWPRSERFDVVSLLNVLDRTMYPRALLRHARAVLAPEGSLVLSIPLPVRAHVHVGPNTVAPEERLPAAGDTFEENANAVAERLLRAEGLRVRRFTRLPYVSHGDTGSALYVLDAALFACVAVD